MQPEQYNDIMSRVINLMSGEKYDAAIALLNPAIEENPRITEAYIHLGNAYVNKGDIKSGIEQFKKALILEPDNGEILYSIASAYVLIDDTLEAVEYFNKAEKAGYKTPELYQYLAVTFLEADDAEQALRNINRAIQLNPLDGRQHLLKARIFIYAGKIDEALETLDEMNKILPDSFAAYNLRAEIYMEIGKYKEALEICNDAYERFPKDPNIAVLKLKALNAAGDFDSALGIVQELRSNGMYDVKVKQIALQEVTAYVGKEMMDKALDVLEEAMAIIGDDEDLLFTAMTISIRGDNSNRIVSICERLLSVAKKEEYIPAAKFHRVEAINKLGKTEEAEKAYKGLQSEFRKITIDSPYRFDVYILRLLCHLRLKEYTEALELGDYLEAYDSESAQPYALKYMIYKEMGDTENAAIQKEKAQSIDPNSVK